MNRLAVYVHIPFCTVKCGYCDFNAYAGMDSLKGSYGDALLAEVDGWRDDLSRHAVTSIAFGGGTPGECPAEHIADVVDAIHEAATVLPGAEVSLEANPGTVSLPYLEGLREAGITRLSLGAQSFDAGELEFLDRIHSPEAISASVSLARRAGFESVNLDLIYGIPGQSVESWERSLQRALDTGPDHLSLYALTVEEGTPLARAVERGAVTPPDADTVAAYYEVAGELLAAEGFEQYELSNWARPGHQSRHNRTYWEYGEYLGLGAGAHGFFEEERYENIAHPREYIHTVLEEGAGRAIAHSYRPDMMTAVVDWLALRLRLLEGFHRDEFHQEFNAHIDAVLGEPLGTAITAGVLDYSGGRLFLTNRGRLLHGEVVARVLAYLRAHPDALSGAAMAPRC